VDLVLGSDSGVLLLPLGLGTHNELQLLQKAGLSPFDALKAGTINGAKALGKDKELGQIQPGFRADFIFTREDPIQNLDALRYPDAMLKSGQWHDKANLKNIRENAIDDRSIFSELWLILSNY
jgi:imidazolonepropionase-like amidohydrolase